MSALSNRIKTSAASLNYRRGRSKSWVASRERVWKPERENSCGKQPKNCLQVASSLSLLSRVYTHVPHQPPVFDDRFASIEKTTQTAAAWVLLFDNNEEYFGRLSVST